MFINGLFKSSFFDRAGGFVDEFVNTVPPTMPQAMENVVPFSEVTKTSTGTGDWNVAGTWNPSGVPGANDKVRIQSGHTVTVKGNNTAKVEWCRVEGVMDFDTAADSKLTVGTLFILTGGALRIGTRASPLPSSVTAEIVIADLGAFDLTKDTWKLGRGLLSSGTAEVKLYGAPKTPFVKLGADMSAGSTSATLASTPTGWAVGDEVVLGADDYDGWQQYTSPPYWRYNTTRDEEVTLTSASGTSIGWTGGTTYTHASPSGRSDLKPVVANLSRNIKIYTENPTTVPDDSGNTNGLRGHCMFMGSSDIDLRYVEFRDLGRTNKAIPSVIAATQLETGPMETTTNVRGRYGVHFHFMGVDDAKVLAPPQVFGCVVAGSQSTGFMPGWGMVQHSSGGNWWGNICYYVGGAGFVTETGNERGVWRDCLAMSLRGYSTQPSKTAGHNPEDSGISGCGFFMPSRFIRIPGCKAVSCNYGFDAMHRTDAPDERNNKLEDTEIKPLHIPSGGDGVISISDPSIRHWTDLEAIACTQGMHIEKSNSTWRNEKQTIINNVTVWHRTGPPRNSNSAGAVFEYTGGYVLDDFDILNVRPRVGTINFGTGIKLGQNAWRITIQNTTINGAEYGVKVNDTANHTSASPAKDGNGRNIGYNITFSNISKGNIDRDGSIYPDDFILVTSPPESAFSLDSGTTATEDTSGSSFFALSFSGNLTDFYGTSAHGINYTTQDISAFITRYSGNYTDGADVKTFFPMMWTDRGRLEDHMDLLVGTMTDRASEGTVNSPNTAPSVTSFSTTATANTSTSDITTTTLDLATLASVSDTDGDTPLYYFVNSTDNIQIVNEDDSNGTVKLIPDVGYTGTDSFKFWVWDGQSGITEGTCTVTVS